MAPLCQYRDAMTEFCLRYIQNENGVKSLFRFNYAYYAHILTVTVIFWANTDHYSDAEDNGRLRMKSRKIKLNYVNYLTFSIKPLSRKGSAAFRQDPGDRLPDPLAFLEQLTENYFLASGIFYGTGRLPDPLRGRRREEAAAARPGENPPPRSTPSECSRSPSP